MKIAIEGCAHGELEKIYATIAELEKAEAVKVDLLLCCGDFQATRNLEDLQTMAVPKKYQSMGTFYKYYSGELVAPMLTLVIGGNHEASNYLQELPYGGWLAPNIYYLGYAGVVRVNGIRIAGLSGIYKGHDFLKGRHEYPPYSEDTRRSVYHIRQLEVFRLKQLSGRLDIFISHDWPRGIYNHGDKEQLGRFKPHFRDEMDSDTLGCRPCEELLKELKPLYWFAAHLHCKFAAMVVHPDSASDASDDEDHSSEEENCKESRITKFLALDKCIPKRRFLQVIDIPAVDPTEEGAPVLKYDEEWLTILYLTNHLISVKPCNYYMPGPRGNLDPETRSKFTPTVDEVQHVRSKFNDNLRVPTNFGRTVEHFCPETDFNSPNHPQPKAQINPQSMQFCDTLGIDDPLTLAMLIGGHELSVSVILDDSQVDTTMNTTTNADATAASMVEPSPVKRKSSLGLSLPKPSVESEALFKDTPTNEEAIPLSSDEEVLPAEDEPKATPEKAEEEVVESSTSTPPVKKFRRRNQDLYKEPEEDLVVETG